MDKQVSNGNKKRVYRKTERRDRKMDTTGSNQIKTLLLYSKHERKKKVIYGRQQRKMYYNKT